MRRLPLGMLVVVATTLAGPARAQDPSVGAAQLFRAGEAAHAKGDYAAAARSFEEAYRHAPHAAAMFNAAHEWEAAHEKTRAADAYALAISHGELGAKELAEARARLSELERGTAIVTIDAPRDAKVWLAQADGASAPASVHVAPGTYSARVRFADGTTETRKVRADLGAKVRVAFEPPPPPPPPATQRTLGWVALGGSAAVAVAAILLGTQAVDARDALVASKDTSARARDQAVSYKLWTNVAWAGAGALAITGAVLLFTAPSGKDAPPDAAPPARAELRVVPGGALLVGRF